jgi:TonB family protein
VVTTIPGSCVCAWAAPAAIAAVARAAGSDLRTNATHNVANAAPLMQYYNITYRSCVGTGTSAKKPPGHSDPCFREPACLVCNTITLHDRKQAAPLTCAMTAPLPGEKQSQAAAVVALVPLAASVRLASDHFRQGRWQRLVPLGLAVAAHLAVLYALAQEPPDLMAGGGGHQLDAISVTIVNSNVLESRDAGPDALAPATLGAVEVNDGQTQSTPAPQQPEQKKAEVPQEQARDEPVTADATTLLPAETPKQERKETSAAPPAGGNTARGDSADTPVQSAPATASPGAVREYATYVSQALAKAKPKGVGTYGTVLVKLRISPDGELTSVEIGKSSGNKKLDETVLAAVQRVKLRSPPAGMTADQRWYQVNYYFR